MKRARLAKAVATREDAVAAKAAIEGTTVEIAAKVSESGKLFGGISNEAIAVALSDKAAVNPKAIEVETIKTTGDFPAKVALHPEITRFLLREGRGRVSHSGLVLESHRPRV